MNRITKLALFLWFISFAALAQTVKTPDEIYGQLFRDVQMQGIFPDGKTFVDCVPEKDPQLIISEYNSRKNDAAFSLKSFVKNNFQLPPKIAVNYHSDPSESIKIHIEQLWKVLQRTPDVPVQGSSLLPLPYPYIVPGGRFREIYYWDSYFTMLGLQESGRYELMDNMVKNFAYLIDRYGHIPNGNRSYYLSRSQPPFFSLMISLLAEIKGDSVYQTYLPAMEKEYAYWMKGTGRKLNGANECVVKINEYFVNRYWDSDSIPRQESYRQDVETALQSERDKRIVYNNLRSGAASGWDFSSRWFTDAKHLSSIRITDIVPVDLNSLLCNLERTLYTVYLKNGDMEKASFYRQRLDKRIEFLNRYCWNERKGCYYDYNFKTKKQIEIPTLATVYPLFVKIASMAQADRIASLLKKDFLKPGGLTTTLNHTGQQWDAPNGWPPLEWMAVKGLENYRQKKFAREIAERWINLNADVFHRTGKLMEKYNVEDIHLTAGGGEYPSQDGFGWTNGVLLKMMDQYNIEK